MRTFAQQQNQLQKPISSSLARPNLATLGPDHREHPLLQLQRTIGDQVVLRMPQTHAEELEVGSTSTAASRLAHDFSRIPVYAKAPVPLSGKLTANANETRTPSVLHAVDAVLRAPGQRLDEQTRDFFESRFGYDFSQVRVHTDASAVSSVDVLDARAYTVGHDISFGRNEYVPESESGRFLIAHELAHVVQQQNTTASTHSGLEIGNPSDRAEQEADAFAHAALLAAPRLKKSGTLPGISHLPRPSISHRVLRRDPKDAACKDKKTETWAGCFDTAWYRPTRDSDSKAVRYGADIGIVFKPNYNVDAEKIAFVQTAQSSQGGQPVAIYFKDAKSDDLSDPDVGPKIRGVASRDFGPKAKDTQTSRMIDALDSAAGTAIDSLPKQRTPLVGMTDPDKGSELSSSGPTKFGKFGWHHRNKGKLEHEDATMRDTPGLVPPKQVEAQQIFETTALAVAGAQKGAFYGSVQWGWNKSSSDDKVTLVPFRLLRESTPSAEFGEAAKLWNASKTTNDEPSIGLPMVAEMFTTPKKATLMDSPDKGKSLANLDINTRVEVTDKTDSAHKDWRNVVVVSGPSAGKVGWVKQESLSDRPTETKRRSPVQK